MFGRRQRVTKIAAAPGVAPIEIVPMRRRDVRDVIAIERQVFTLPWSENLYISELSMPSTRLYYVARANGTIVGYVGCMLVVGDGHITTIGVAPEFQRRKIGMALLYRAVTEARARNTEAMTLEVRVSNRGAQELYRTFGFAPVGIRRAYYADDNEDAIVMWAYGLQTDEYAERIARIGDHLADYDALRLVETDTSSGAAEASGGGAGSAGQGQ
jgi:ribosomal-protein-alanine N-acetyltransferase